MATESLIIRIIENGAAIVKRRIDGIADSSDRATRQLNLMRKAMFIVGGAGALAVLGRYADQLTAMENRLKLTSTSASNLEEVQDRLLAAANRSRTGFVALGEVYSRMALSARSLGRTQGEIIAFTESLAKAATISGATAQEARNALIQLGQGVASNTLRGDELRSVLEQLPFVADVIGKELIRMGKIAGASFDSAGDAVDEFGNKLNLRGVLRELAADGQISAEVVLNAFRAAKDEIDGLFDQTNVTIAQAFAVANNNLLEFIDNADDSSNASEKLAKSIIAISENLDKILEAAIAVGGALAAALGIGLVRQVAGSFIMLGRFRKELFLIVAAATALAGIQVGNFFTEATRKGQEMADTLDSVVDAQMAVVDALAEFESAPSVKTAETAASVVEEQINRIETALDAAREKFEFQKSTQGILTDNDDIFETVQVIETLSTALANLEVRQREVNAAAADMGPQYSGIFEPLANLKIAQDALVEAQFRQVEGISALREEYGFMAEVMQQQLEIENQLAEARVRQDVTNQVAGIAALAAETKLAREEAILLSVGLDNIRFATGFADQATQAQNLINEIIRMQGGIDQLDGFWLQVVSALNQVVAETANAASQSDILKAIIAATKGDADALAGAIANLASKFAGPIAAASKLLSIVNAILGALGGIGAGLRNLAGNVANVAAGAFDALKKSATSADSALGKAGNNLKAAFTNFVDGASTNEVKKLLADNIKADRDLAREVAEGLDFGDLAGGTDGGGGGSKKGGAKEELSDVAKLQKEILESIEGPQQRLRDGTEALNNLFAMGAINIEQYNEKLRELQVAALKAEGTLSGGFKSALIGAMTSASQFGEQLGNFVIGQVGKLSDAIVEFAKTGKFNIKQFFAEFFAGLLKLATQRLLLNLLGGLVGGAGGLTGGSLLGGLFGFAGGGSILPGGGSFAPTGPGSTDSQVVAFKKRPDERVDILTPSQQSAQRNAMNGGGSGGGKAPEVNQKIINILDPALVGSFLNTPEGEDILVNVIQRSGIMSR